MFIQFSWGRSRLPAAGRWRDERRFKLSKMVRQGITFNTLPVAHTCFFQIELPDTYRSDQEMHDRLITAMEGSIGFTGFA